MQSEVGTEEFLSKLTEICQYAVALLKRAGILDLPSLSNKEDEEYWDVLYDCCFDWLERQQEPDLVSPGDPIICAAMTVILTYEVRGALILFADQVLTDCKVDFDLMSSALYFAAGLGALSETFRADLGGFLNAPSMVKALKAASLAQHRPGGLGRSKQKIAEAEQWHTPCIKWAQEFLDAWPSGERLTLSALADKIIDGWEDRPFKTLGETKSLTKRWGYLKDDLLPIWRTKGQIRWPDNKG